MTKKPATTLTTAPQVAEQPERDRMLTTKQVAEWLNCSTHSVHSLYFGGKLPAVPIGTGKNPHRRYRLSDVEAFIKNNRVVETPFVPSDPRIDAARQEQVKKELRERGYKI